MDQDSSNRRRRLSDAASAHVRGLIVSGRIRPGEVIRPETVGDALGISVTPVREGLQALRAEGFVDLQQGSGFVVAPLTGADIRDLFTAQALIAGELAARAASAATDEDLAEIVALHHEMQAAAIRRDLELLESKNHEFHRRINRIGDAPKIAWVVGLLGQYVPRKFYASVAGWPAATTDDHSAIVEAIVARDPEAARAAMAAHIVHAGELLAEEFDRRAPG